jgi:hypothetical protein
MSSGYNVYTLSVSRTSLAALQWSNVNGRKCIEVHGKLIKSRRMVGRQSSTSFSAKDQKFPNQETEEESVAAGRKGSRAVGWAAIQ